MTEEAIAQSKSFYLIYVVTATRIFLDMFKIDFHSGIRNHYYITNFGNKVFIGVLLKLRVKIDF